MPLGCCVQLDLKRSEGAVEEDTDRYLEAESGRYQYPSVAVENNAALIVPRVLGSDNSHAVGVVRGVVEVLMKCRARRLCDGSRLGK